MRPKSTQRTGLEINYSLGLKAIQEAGLGTGTPVTQLKASSKGWGLSLEVRAPGLTGTGYLGGGPGETDQGETDQGNCNRMVRSGP